MVGWDFEGFDLGWVLGHEMGGVISVLIVFRYIYIPVPYFIYPILYSLITSIRREEM